MVLSWTAVMALGIVPLLMPKVVSKYQEGVLIQATQLV